MSPQVSSLLHASRDSRGTDTVPSGSSAELVEPTPPLGGSRPHNTKRPRPLYSLSLQAPAHLYHSHRQPLRILRTCSVP